MQDQPLIFVAENCSLPKEAEERSQLLEDLSAAVSNVLIEYGMYPDRYRLYDGHLYAQASTHVNCPKCHERLHLRSVGLDRENGADAIATCDCGWSGRAIYRLIDLQADVGSTQQTTLTGSHTSALYSAVAAGESPVTYTPYRNTEMHFFTPGQDS